MKAHSLILLVPSLAMVMCVIHTAVSRTSYDVQFQYVNRQLDFALEEGNFRLVTYKAKRGKDYYKFKNPKIWNPAKVTIYSFLGNRPGWYAFEATDNTEALPGTKIAGGSFPLWMAALVLLGPFVFFISRYRKRTKRH